MVSTQGVMVREMDTKTRCLLMGLRQVLIMALGLLEDYLDLDRSVMSRHKRD